jgi:hypothetical protein
MHAIESDRMAREQRQMDSYAAAVMQQQRQQEQERQGAADAPATAGETPDATRSSGGSSPWQSILRLDPLARKMRRSKLARMSFRR